MSDSAPKTDVEDVLSSIRRLVSDTPVRHEVDAEAPSQESSEDKRDEEPKEEPSAEATEDTTEALVLTSDFRVSATAQSLEENGLERDPTAIDLAGLRQALRRKSDPEGEVSASDREEMVGRDLPRSRLHLSSVIAEEAEEASDESQDEITGEEADAPSEARGWGVSAPEDYYEDEMVFVRSEETTEAWNAERVTADEQADVDVSGDASEETETQVDEAAPAEPEADQIDAASDTVPFAAPSEETSEIAKGSSGAEEALGEVPEAQETGEADTEEDAEDIDISAALSEALSDEEEDENLGEEAGEDAAAHDEPADDENKETSVDAGGEEAEIAVIADEPAPHDVPDLSQIDEELLEAMLARAVRQELTGEMGERITRNIRKLVRREIQRALSAREFD
ncbi:MAG: hypothetical protein HKP40_05250 [Litoreibacter sp.]|nr:hypothetical protein [Litoreibacter sp.]